MSELKSSFRSSSKSPTHGSPVSAKGVKLKGRPLQIVFARDDHSFDLNEDLLKQVLLHPTVADKKVVVVSVAGAFRKGKSFLLDFCLRYLNAQPSSDWLGDDNSPLEGFPWRGGAERDTTGILMWSEPFPVKLPESGEEVVVLLMDTQGAFDSMSTVKDCATVFALSQLLSSVQVYNVMVNVQEDDLQHLQLFTEYGRLAMEGNTAKPFQDLHFLVRDWQYPYEHEYGDVGGMELINKRLQIHDGQSSELEKLRKHIRSCFRKVNCFLMPHPGLKVATNQYFDGRLSDITKDFKEHLKHFIPLILSPSKLVIKQINGAKINAIQLLEYFKSYIALYQGDQFPEPQSMLTATAEANNRSTVATAKDLYYREMSQICDANKPYLHTDLLTSQHLRYKDASLHLFDKTLKMGGEEFSHPYRSKLEADICQKFNQIVKENESKNVFAIIKTPGILLCFIVGLYMNAGVLALMGITPLATLSNLAFFFFLFILSIWLYSRYTGEVRELAEVVDDFAAVLWENFLGPTWTRILEGGARRNDIINSIQ